jgi:hypothetical protein
MTVATTPNYCGIEKERFKLNTLISYLKSRIGISANNLQRTTSSYTAAHGRHAYPQINNFYFYFFYKKKFILLEKDDANNDDTAN